MWRLIGRSVDTLSMCLCMIGCWLHIESFDMFIRDACLAFMFICDIDMLTTWIDSLVCFSIWLFLLYDYLALLDMYILLFVYLIHIGMIDSLYCILSYLSQHIVYSCYIPVLFSYFLLSLCVDMDDIPVLCLAACCMTTLFLCDTCVACLCGVHIYPLTSNSLVSIDLVFPWSHIWYETCYFVCSLIELVIQSKV